MKELDEEKRLVEDIWQSRCAGIGFRERAGRRVQPIPAHAGDAAGRGGRYAGDTD